MKNEYYDYDRCRASLAELRPKIGRYGWMIALLKLRARQRGGFPTRVLGLLRRFARRDRPYFIGTTGDGTRFLGDFFDDYSLSWAVDPAYDHDVVSFMKTRAGQLEGVYLDVGSNAAILAATVGRHARGKLRVVAIEAMPTTARRAAATLALNGLSEACVLNVAIGNAEGELSLFEASGNSGWASAYPPERVSESAGMQWVSKTVRCRTLDAIADEIDLSGLRFMKVDVEGHELNVFRGAVELLERERPVVLYEHNPLLMSRAGWDADHLASLMRDQFHYEMCVIEADGSLGSFPPPPKTVVANIFCQPELVAQTS